jgi:hypothetical protein
MYVGSMFFLENIQATLGNFQGTACERMLPIIIKFYENIIKRPITNIIIIIKKGKNT